MEQVEKFNKIIDEVYEKYRQENKKVMYLTFLLKEEFINKCKTNPEFSGKWGLKIEERGLTDKERLNTLIQNEQRLIYEKVQSFKNLGRKTIKSCLDEKNIPTRIITITYNNKIIETYE